MKRKRKRNRRKRDKNEGYRVACDVNVVNSHRKHKFVIRVQNCAAVRVCCNMRKGKGGGGLCWDGINVLLGVLKSHKYI